MLKPGCATHGASNASHRGSSHSLQRHWSVDGPSWQSAETGLLPRLSLDVTDEEACLNKTLPSFLSSSSDGCQSPSKHHCDAVAFSETPKSFSTTVSSKADSNLNSRLSCTNKFLNESKPAKYICSNVVEPRVVLYSIGNAPKFLINNKFIWTGYRAFLPYKICIKSIFMWTNETLNIWTHIFGCLFFFFLMLYDNLILMPQFQNKVQAGLSNWQCFIDVLPNLHDYVGVLPCFWMSR